MNHLTPKEIVQELDKYVVGQKDAKVAVAIAFRNRYRRKLVADEELREEIYPHNILMVGPTGVGKTEIAKRLAKLIKAPFLKVEATKFTEVGYVGRDVDSIIRDLAEIGVSQMRERMRQEVESKATQAAAARIIDALVGENSSPETKAKFYEKFKRGQLDDKEIEITVSEAPNQPSMPMFDIPGGQMGVMNIGEMLGKVMGGAKTKSAKMSVKDAFKVVLKEESDKLIDEEKMILEAINSIENDGIVFIDEIDKITARSDEAKGGSVSREGVQRDLLPLLEGSTVATKHGAIRTDHILFIGSGAFHLAKPSDMLPELQGRLPIRVELSALSEEDLVKILKEPKHSLIKQYAALLAVEKVALDFVDSGIKEIARIAFEINREVENIGARRLHTILEKLLEEINFTASDKPNTTIKIDKKFVQTKLADITKKTDLAKFIL
ncbi:MAG: ATP-dependent protease ATPase subunit HslU [Rickettsiales bacterium]